MKPALQHNVTLLIFAALVTFTFTTSVSAYEGAPDLVVKEIVFESAPSKIRVRVLNQGTGASASCYLALQSLMRSNAPVSTKQRVWSIPIPALEAGKGFSNAIDVSPLAQTDGPWQAFIDRSNTVAESNENNNTLAYTTSSSGKSGPASPNRRRPDLVINHFELNDPSSGQVTVEVTNKGGGNSAGCKLRLIIWEPGKFEQKEAKTVFVRVPPLQSVQSTTVVARAGVPVINTKFSMYVDIGEEVVETNENNNRAEGEAGNFKP